MTEFFLTNKKRKNDIILAVVIVVIATVGLIMTNALREEGKYVVVKIDGEIVCRYSLSENRKETLSYENDYKNVLVIENNEAFIESANCKDKICVEHKSVKKSGESIICLPHKLVVEITDESDDKSIDAVV